MLSKSKHGHGNTSTPKRRRLGTGKILRPNLQVFGKENNILQSPNTRPESPFDPHDDPPLPCNQIEYLCDSGNTSSESNIPCSPGVLEWSIMKNTEKWESLVSTDLTTIINKAQESIKELDEIEDISDEMFYSKLEQESSQCNHVSSSLLTTNYEKHFRDNIEESFDEINQLNKLSEKSDGSFLSDTKDAILLNIKETELVLRENQSEDFSSKANNDIIASKDSFYGLPMVTKGLFKSYRNIDKFYDWQEECLNLPAIRDHRNLIYALPTSGGKTLVAEVLMLREVLCRKKNALFILPFVAIVQEKIWSLSPFAVKLDFLVEEYAAGKGNIPPKKRRKKNSIFVATIEKGLALVRSLIEENRLEELGLVVVDELHLIGEPGRGATLEILLSTILFANKGIQIVGMSATIGNLPELAGFMRAEVFQREFRPVELTEFVKLGDMLYRILWKEDAMEVVPDRQLAFDYTSAGASLDPDRLGGLVAEVVPRGSCLVFCPTKRNCENVATLLCKLQRREMVAHRSEERASLAAALRAEGSSAELQRAALCGIAYHHAGLSADERSLLEHAYRGGAISVLCCTSTLAAGVNLPAQRVIIRAPRVGRDLISLGSYKQMVGRAGRAGICDNGESIIICSGRDWPRLRAALSGGLGAARSVLAPRLPELLLSAVALRLATTRPALRAVLACTLLAASDGDSPLDEKQMCDDALRSLLQGGALEVGGEGRREERALRCGDCVLHDGSELAVSNLGRAAIRGCMELAAVKQLLEDVAAASRALVLMGSLHLLFLVTPRAAAPRPDYRHYYSLYCNLDEEGIQTAKILGITEMNAIRMMTGKPITNVPESVLCRFYLALMLHDLWKQMPVSAAAHKYWLPRGTVQAVMTSAAAFAASAARACDQLEPLWPFAALLAELAARLRHCAAPELTQLMELPAVKKARALQLVRAGYKRVEELARASAQALQGSVPHLSRSGAEHLISAARLMLIEKVENLRAEAEIVMEELNV